jgi:VWFA-related protein
MWNVTTKLTFCAAFVAATAVTSLRIGDAAEQVQQPSFRAAIQLIEVDVHVTDKSGRFITGLSQEAFDMMDDGEPQRIALFLLVHLATRDGQIEQLGATPFSVTADQNRAVGGRSYIMLLDGPAAAGDHVQRMRSVARHFLDLAFGPGDQMAVMFVKGKFLKYFEGHEDQMVEQPFTTDRRAIEAAIDRLAPDTKVATGVQGVIRTYETIEDISNQLGTMGGRRKALIWLGGQVPFDPSERGSTQRRGAEIASMYSRAIHAANRHNVAIYPIDLLGLTNRMTGRRDLQMGRNGEELKRMAALRAIAEDTGGEAVVGTNNYEQMFAQIATHTSAYYLLGYQPSGTRCDGRFHAITVRVKRAGAVVRARRGYFAPEPRNASTASAREDVNSATSGVCQ